jgi:hypothetical protein
MDLLLRVLLRAAQWSRRRPSKALVITVCVTVAVALAIAAVEHFVGWPQALTLEPLPRRPVIR